MNSFELKTPALATSGSNIPIHSKTLSNLFVAFWKNVVSNKKSFRFMRGGPFLWAREMVAYLLIFVATTIGTN